MTDIYFEPNYGKLYGGNENEYFKFYEFKSSLGTVIHLFIMRKIPLEINNQCYFDLVTPYGYGGPIITECIPGYKLQLVKEFEMDFKSFCSKNDIVSEFVRFHPVKGNATDFESVYSINNIRKTVGTNIKDFEDPITSEFSKSTRKMIRKILKLGVTYRITEKPDSLERFKKIYYSTMDRNNASDYYYFDDNYFNMCLEYFQEHIILVEVLYEEKVIASGFYFVSGNVVHAHLSGTLKDYLYLSPAYIIKYATADWAKENNIHLIHYGGGTSNSEDDPLYKFKKKFGKNTEFDFYVGKRIWNENIYRQLCEVKRVDNDISFFPAYRYN